MQQIPPTYLAVTHDRRGYRAGLLRRWLNLTTMIRARLRRDSGFIAWD